MRYDCGPATGSGPDDESLQLSFPALRESLTAASILIATVAVYCMIINLKMICIFIVFSLLFYLL